MSKVTIPSIQLLQWSYSLKYTEAWQSDNKGSELKACCSNESPKQTCKYRPHANTGVLLPCDLLAPQQPTCVHTHPQRHIFHPPAPNSSLHQDPGRLTPPPTTTTTPHSPLRSPLPLSPSATDHCLLSLSSTALLVWGAGRIVTLLSGPPLQPPLPCQPGLTPFTVLKSTICITQQSGTEREGELGQEGERKQGGEKGADGRGGRAGRARKGDRGRGIWMGVALSVVKYLSNTFHSVKVSLLLFFLQTWCLLIFLLPPFISSF